MPGRQGGFQSGAGTLRAVLGTASQALAIDHHRACQHQLANPGPGHPREYLGGSHVVGRRVVGKVRDRHPEADFRCQMHDRVNAGQSSVHRSGVAHITNVQLDRVRGLP